MGALSSWTVEFYDLLRPPLAAADDLVPGFGDLHERASRNGARHGTPVILSPEGRADPRINLFFRTGAMASARSGTWRRYGYALVVWLDFLDLFGRRWDAATARDVEMFKDWRLSDVRNEGRVSAATFDTDRGLGCAAVRREQSRGHDPWSQRRFWCEKGCEVWGSGRRSGSVTAGWSSATAGEVDAATGV